MSDIQIYRSGVCYLGTCNRKGVHKENFDCLWDLEWSTLESKVSFIASLQVDFLRDEAKSREVLPADLLPSLYSWIHFKCSIHFKYSVRINRN